MTGAPSRGRLRVLLTPLALLVLGAAALAQLDPLHAGHRDIRAPRAPLYLPSPALVEIACLGHRTTVADAYYLWAIQYFTGRIGPARSRMLVQAFDTITDLDPKFRDAYWLGFVSLLDEAGDRDAAFALVDKALANDPDYTLIAIEAALSARMTGDRERTLHYLRIASETASDPVAQRLLVKLQDVDTAQQELAEWSRLLDSTDEFTRSVARSHVRDLRVVIDVERLRILAGCYERERGIPPASLDQLVVAGYLSEVPRDPEGNEYLYDARTRDLRSKKRYRNVPPSRALNGVDVSDLGRCAPLSGGAPR